MIMRALEVMSDVCVSVRMNGGLNAHADVVRM